MKRPSAVQAVNRNLCLIFLSFAILTCTTENLNAGLNVLYFLLGLSLPIVENIYFLFAF